MIYQTLYNPFIEVLLNLRFGVFFTHVPRISHFSTLTENGLQVKIRSIKRFFYPKVKDLIAKLSNHSTAPLNIREDMIACQHQRVSDLSSIKFNKEDWQDRTGPIYPPNFRKYYFCRICYVNESNKCLHWIIFFPPNYWLSCWLLTYLGNELHNTTMYLIMQYFIVHNT